MCVQGEGSESKPTKEKRSRNKTRKATTMKKTARIEINHIDATIIMTKKFYEAACHLNTPEYKELMAARRDNPTYKLEVRTINKKADKNSYRNLTFDNMEIFIRKSMDSVRPLEERLDEYEAVKSLSKAQASPYAYVKTWFLKEYGDEYNKYNKAEEEKAA